MTDLSGALKVCCSGVTARMVGEVGGRDHTQTLNAGICWDGLLEHDKSGMGAVVGLLIQEYKLPVGLMT